MVVKKTSRLFTTIAAVIFGVYASVVLLFSLPFMQTKLAGWTASLLSDKVGAKVEIGSINVGLLNRVVVNDIVLYQPDGQQMASVARASVSISVWQLMQKRVVINAAQLFGVNATLYRDTPDSAPNYQFLVDAFSDKEKKEPSQIDLDIHSFIMRRANINYDVKSEPRRQPLFDVNHLALRGCGVNLALQFVTDQSIDANIRRLQAFDKNSGLQIDDICLHLTADNTSATLSDFHIETPESVIECPQLAVTYGDYKTKGCFTIEETNIEATVTPNEFAAFNANLERFEQPITIAATIAGDEKRISVKDLSLQCEAWGELAASLTAQSPLTDHYTIDVDVQRLDVSHSGISNISSFIQADSLVESKLAALGDVHYTGNANFSRKDSATYTLTNDGTLHTDIGALKYNLAITDDRTLTCKIEADSVSLAHLTNNDDFGKTSFTLSASANLAETTSQNHSDFAHTLTAARVEGNIQSLGYRGYNYQNITFDALCLPEHNAINSHALNATISGNVQIDDDNIALTASGSFTDNGQRNITADVQLDKFMPYNMHLIDNHEGESLAMHAVIDMHGNDINTMMGHASINNLTIHSADATHTLEHLDLSAMNDGGISTYTIASDFLNAQVSGRVHPTDIAESFKAVLSEHIPLYVKSSVTPDAHFDYDFTISDHTILHYLTDADFTLQQPISATGSVDTHAHQMSVNLSAPTVTVADRRISDIDISCLSTAKHLHTLVSGREEDTGTKIRVEANTHNNVVDGNLDLAISSKYNLNVNLRPTIALSDTLGRTKAQIALAQSHAVINDTVWTISPSNIIIHGSDITCKGVKLWGANGSSVAIDGTASRQPKDSLTVTLSDFNINYITEAANMQSFPLTGYTSGSVTMRGIMAADQMIDFAAHLNMRDLTLRGGSLGSGDVYASWDKQNETIKLNAQFIDHYHSAVPSTPNNAANSIKHEVKGITTATGWISPSRNDMRIDVSTDHTNAAFLYGLLPSVFTQVDGSVNGQLAIVGLSPINLIGNPKIDIDFTLRATKMPYSLRGETVHLGVDAIQLRNATLHDHFNNQGKVQVDVRHHNLKNFSYDIHADLNHLCAYDERRFNSDKFYATVFANGTVDVNGSDGHPLYVNADITPTRGSLFAYDAATPDAIIGNSFIEFADRDTISTDLSGMLSFADNDTGDILPITDSASNVKLTHSIAQEDSLAIVEMAKNAYRGDIYFNANIHLTPDCEVSLRMDNKPDGYMHTRGYADLNAQWHNKGAFQLFGNYDIQQGSYRLYLQDMIFRDLALQPTSDVVFNGNPFDASIHLVCHHPIPAVPLSDLTSTKAFSQNNKVKVISVLDITGHLDNMDFKFDMQLPNVSDEIRQLARSMINSDEEMNTQMIYLLAFGRFYPSEYARSSGDNNTDQAVNSLLSSTISGQLNQMMTNMLGRDSKWSLGSSLSTGETGWDDLDVEGTLSGRLFDERLLLNGNFGYRDNALTNQANFIGDFEVKLRLSQQGNIYLKAYNQANDRYFTKATLNTQGIGLSWQHDFDRIFTRRRSLVPLSTTDNQSVTPQPIIKQE